MKRESNPQIEAQPGSAKAPALVTPGEVVQSAFRIIGEVATTETGTVFAAHDMLVERDVALKFGWRDQAPGQILAEARRCASVKDPCAVLVHGIGSHRDIEFAVAERLTGKPLREMLGGAALSPAIYLRRLRQIVAGVVAMHDAGLAAGDLSSHTIWQCNDGRLVLGRVSLSQVPAFGPDGAFITPEIALGHVEAADPAAAESGDLYHLGCIAIELSRGAPPFDGNFAGLQRAHAYDQPPRLIDLRADLPSELSDLVAWLLEKEPAARPRSAADVLSQLDAVIERQGVTKRSLRVLVIDDDTGRARWLSNITRRASSQVIVETAHEGTEAAHKLNRDQPDVVIIDATLRGVMNALELCMYTRSLESTVRTQLVLFGEVAANDQAVLERASVAYVDDDQRGPDAILDIIRRAAASITVSPRAKRTTISG
ncbi:MAG TPA: response regulator [Kofleriaceae bacterium]|nr:response regulator [Kofleriaceae bacterium]